MEIVLRSLIHLFMQLDAVDCQLDAGGRVAAASAHVSVSEAALPPGLPLGPAGDWHVRLRGGGAGARDGFAGRAEPRACVRRDHLHRADPARDDRRLRPIRRARGLCAAVHG